jgi:hypothetical protein
LHPIAASLASGVVGALGRVGAMTTIAPLTGAATSGSVIQAGDRRTNVTTIESCFAVMWC